MNGRRAPVLHLQDAVWHQEENEAAASLLLGLFLCSTARQWHSHNTAEEGNDWSRRLRQRKGALRTTRQRASSFTSRQLTVVYSGQIRVYNSRYNPASAPNTLNRALIQALSGSSAACKFVIEDFNELASPRMARRSRDRKWLISIHFGNYRLNARADIIIRGPILCGDSLLRQSHSPGSLPPRTSIHRRVTL